MRHHGIEAEACERERGDSVPRHSRPSRSVNVRGTLSRVSYCRLGADAKRRPRELEHPRPNRYPTQLSGQQRRTIRAACTPGVLDETAEERKNGSIVQSFCLEFIAGLSHCVVKRPAELVRVTAQRVDE
jgi:hypothetical protein